MGECLKQYFLTGTTVTPSHGSGQRVPKKNGRFISDDESEGLDADEPSSPVVSMTLYSIIGLGRI